MISDYIIVVGTKSYSTYLIGVTIFTVALFWQLALCLVNCLSYLV